ncbi:MULTISPECIES: hypothetical protein [Bacillus cereus group]|nr:MULTISPECIES: hypothetical protein [Bacillus cereus group]
MNFSIHHELQLFAEELQRYLTITYIDNYSMGLSVLLKNLHQNLS